MNKQYCGVISSVLEFLRIMCRTVIKFLIFLVDLYTYEYSKIVCSEGTISNFGRLTLLPIVVILFSYRNIRDIYNIKFDVK